MSTGLSLRICFLPSLSSACEGRYNGIIMFLFRVSVWLVMNYYQVLPSYSATISTRNLHLHIGTATSSTLVVYMYERVCLRICGVPAYHDLRYTLQGAVLHVLVLALHELQGLVFAPKARCDDTTVRIDSSEFAKIE